jgi:hypothetical protein
MMPKVHQSLIRSFAWASDLFGARRPSIALPPPEPRTPGLGLCRLG